MKTTVWLLSLCFPLLSVAQKEWTLSEAVQYALQNNIQIKRTDLNAQSADETYDQSRLSQLPSLNGSATQGFNFGRSVDPFTNEFTTQTIKNNNFSLFSSVTLFNGLQQRNNIKRNYFEMLAAKYDVDQMKNDVALNVASSYLQLLFNRELLRVAEKQVELTQIQVDRIQQLVDAGSLPKGNLLDILAQLASEERQLINAQNALDLSRLAMGILLVLDDPSSFRAASVDFALDGTIMLEHSAPELFSIAKENQPQIQAAKYRMMSADRGLASAKGGLSPRLSMNASMGTGYSDGRKEIDQIMMTDPVQIGYTSSGEDVFAPNFSQTFRTTPFNTQIQDNFSQSIGFSLNIPIFNGGQVRRNINQSRIQQMNAQYVLEQAENTLRQNIEQAYTDARAAMKSYVAAEKSLEATQLAFDYAQQRYELGMINAFEYNDAKNRLVRANSDLLQAKYDYIFKVKVLEFYKSNELSF